MTRHEHFDWVRAAHLEHTRSIRPWCQLLYKM